MTRKRKLLLVMFPILSTVRCLHLVPSFPLLSLAPFPHQHQTKLYPSYGPAETLTNVYIRHNKTATTALYSPLFHVFRRTPRPWKFPLPRRPELEDGDIPEAASTASSSTVMAVSPRPIVDGGYYPLDDGDGGGDGEEVWNDDVHTDENHVDMHHNSNNYENINAKGGDGDIEDDVESEGDGEDRWVGTSGSVSVTTTTDTSPGPGSRPTPGPGPQQESSFSLQDNIIQDRTRGQACQPFL